jgi:CheY-like chemotaxis protein
MKKRLPTIAWLFLTALSIFLLFATFKIGTIDSPEARVFLSTVRLYHLICLSVGVYITYVLIKYQREIASCMLEKLGYETETVATGEAAVSYLQQHHADLLVLDMAMDPGIDGLETDRRILSFKPHQKAIIASGYSESIRVKQALQLGAGAYVRKPYTVEKIARALQNELKN